MTAEEKLIVYELKKYRNKVRRQILNEYTNPRIVANVNLITARQILKSIKS